MKVALIGGIDRLEPHYRREARQAGHELKIFFQNETGLYGKIGSTELVIILTNKVSHSARLSAIEAARSRGVPFLQIHSSGISTFRDCLGRHGNATNPDQIN